jgi:hypothetical protein
LRYSPPTLQHRSVVAGTPLIYVIHDKDVATKEEKSSNYWDLVDDDFVSTCILNGKVYLHDNKCVFDLLKPLIMEGLGSWLVQPFNKSAMGVLLSKP